MLPKIYSHWSIVCKRFHPEDLAQLRDTRNATLPSFFKKINKEKKIKQFIIKNQILLN